MMIADWLDVVRGRPQRVAGGNKGREKKKKGSSFKFHVSVECDRIAGMSYVDHLKKKSVRQGSIRFWKDGLA
jgi:hypothetical protein